MAPRSKTVSPAALSDREIRVISKALADPRRFEIFRQIAINPAVSCGGLREGCCITAPTLSHHLRELESARLIEITRSGKFLNATVNRAVWAAYLSELQSI